MTARELALRLNEIAEQHGDIPVCFWAFSTDSVWAEVMPYHVDIKLDINGVKHVAIDDNNGTAKWFTKYDTK